MVRKEIQDETDRMTGKTRQISHVLIHLSIYFPNVVNLTLIDLPGLTKVAVEGQPKSIAEDIETMVRSYIEKPIKIATSNTIKISTREVDPTGEWTFRVFTKLDLMDKWTCKEREYFASSPDYGHLASKMGSEYLAKLLSLHLESVIRARIPSITSLINKSIDELESEMDHLGRPIALDAGAQLYTILELCCAFEQIFNEHLDGGRPRDDRIYGVFHNQLPAALRKLPFDRHLSLQNVKRIVSEADGYQPHLIAPEQGYCRLIEGALNYFRGPAKASVDAGYADAFYTSKEDSEQALIICLEKEFGYMPEPGYLDYLQSNNLVFARFRAVQWLINTCTRLNLSIGIVFNAANYLDRFLSMSQFHGWKHWMVVNIGCMFIHCLQVQ
ncbi:hypothetical protein REPUB_Repub06bG0027600 [Reevesia pubescens]